MAKALLSVLLVHTSLPPLQLLQALALILSLLAPRVLLVNSEHLMGPALQNAANALLEPFPLQVQQPARPAGQAENRMGTRQHVSLVALESIKLWPDVHRVLLEHIGLPRTTCILFVLIIAVLEHTLSQGPVRALYVRQGRHNLLRGPAHATLAQPGRML